MRTPALSAVAVLGLGVLSACSTALLAPDDRAQVCRVAVRTKPDALAFKPNPMADPVGGPAIGAGVGALALIAAIGFPPYLFVAPAAAATGVACGMASVQRPTAEADFQAIVRTADLAKIGEAMEQAVAAARPACAQPGEPPPVASTTVEFDRIEFTPGCAFGDWGYAIAADWRVTRFGTGAVIAKARTRCQVSTFRDVEAWFGNPDAARVEMEAVLASYGTKLASELLSSEEPSACSLWVVKGGAIAIY